MTSGRQAGFAVPRRPPGAAPFAALPDVIEEHLEELGYLGIQRRKLLFSSDAPFPALSELDHRIRAHEEALALAPQATHQVAESRRHHPDPWQGFVAIRVWLEAGAIASGRAGRALDGLSQEEEPSWREALRRLPPALLRTFLPPPPRPPDGSVPPGLSVDAWAWHGLLPEDLAHHLASAPSIAVRAAVARGVGKNDRLKADLGEASLDDPAAEVRSRAIWSCVLRHPSGAASFARRMFDRTPDDPFVIQTLGLVGDRSDVHRLLTLVHVPRLVPAALRALGHLGDVAAVEVLLDQLESGNAETRLAASDGFRSLVGAVPISPDPPDERSAGPLPLPAREARDLWHRRRTEYAPASRWVGGRPFPPARVTPGETMERRWRLAVLGMVESASRTEVPDGFYAATPTDEALVGE